MNHVMQLCLLMTLITVCEIDSIIKYQYVNDHGRHEPLL